MIAAAAVDSWHRRVVEAAVVAVVVVDGDDGVDEEDDYADGAAAAAGIVGSDAFPALGVAVEVVVAVVDLDSSCWFVGAWA